MPIYEVGIYNEIVRKHVREGTDIPKHIDVSPDFESIIYLERWADSESDARVRIEREFPLSRGYVIDYLKKISG
tara:strand:- start:156 stop:377 length:222 start_codon:yes stop_codon:yes gene_type:complete